MPNSSSFWEHPIDKIEEALSIRKQIASLQARLGSLFGSESATATKEKVSRKGGKRTMSAEGRARIAAAQKARWAKTKGVQTADIKKSKVAKPKKRTMSPEGRAKIAAAAKKRWAAVRAAK